MDSIPLLFNENLSSILAFLTTIITLVYLKQRQNQESIWTKFNVKAVHKPWPIFGGLYDALFRDRIQLEVEHRRKYGKIYGSPMHGKDRIFIADAETIRQVAIKDFDVFTNHGMNPFANKFQANFLVWLQDDHWKRVRSMMTPTFTSGKIRIMFRFLNSQCSEDLVLCCREKMRSSAGGQPVNLLDLFGMYTMDGISTCCYGLKLPRESILVAEGANQKEKTSKKTATRDDLLGAIKKVESLTPHRMVFMLLLPKSVLKFIGFKMSREEDFKPLASRVEKLVQIRRSSSKKHDDLLQLLVDARLGDKVDSAEIDSYENHHAGLGQDTLADDQQNLLNSIRSKQLANNCTLNDHEILSEAAFMLLAGYETTRTLLTNCAYVLSHFEKIQERLYQEVKKIAHLNEEEQRYDFTYDEITSCAYLDAFISETLRFLPPAMHTDRVASRDYTIEKYNVRVPKGESVMFCIYSVQHDPEYWDEPEKFDPDRFMPGRKENIVPGSYIPFSLGPRHCIGMRFSLTETKLGLAKILMHFKFSRAPKSVWPPKSGSIASLLKIKNPCAIVTIRD